MTEIPPASISQIPPPIPVDASAFFQNGADYIQVVDAAKSHIRILSYVDQTFMFRFRMERTIFRWMEMSKLDACSKVSHSNTFSCGLDFHVSFISGAMDSSCRDDSLH